MVVPREDVNVGIGLTGPTRSEAPNNPYSGSSESNFAGIIGDGRDPIEPSNNRHPRTSLFNNTMGGLLNSNGNITMRRSEPTILKDDNFGI